MAPSYEISIAIGFGFGSLGEPCEREPSSGSAIDQNVVTVAVNKIIYYMIDTKAMLIG